MFENIRTGATDTWNKAQGQYHKGRWMAADALQASGKQGRRVHGAYKSWARSSMHKSGKSWVKQELGIGVKSAAGRWLGRGFVGLSAFQGYQEGGIGGAAVATAEHLATTYAMSAAWSALGSVGTGIALGAAGIGALAGAGAGMYLATGGSAKDAFRPWVNEHMKKRAQLEMSTPVVDDYGTVATMRQRSLQAIQNSRLNGRNAIGSEASLLYQPYFR